VWSWLVHLQKIATATMPSMGPSNGLDTANQKETAQPESLVVAFVFTLSPQAFEDRHFTKREISFETLTKLGESGSPPPDQRIRLVKEPHSSG
jgi:hypothetical protein